VPSLGQSSGQSSCPWHRPLAKLSLSSGRPGPRCAAETSAPRSRRPRPVSPRSLEGLDPRRVNRCATPHRPRIPQHRPSRTSHRHHQTLRRRRHSRLRRRYVPTPRPPAQHEFLTAPAPTSPANSPSSTAAPPTTSAKPPPSPTPSTKPASPQFPRYAPHLTSRPTRSSSRLSRRTAAHGADKTRTIPSRRYRGRGGRNHW
jgi:hypothetical protein